jgi:putative transposase
VSALQALPADVSKTKACAALNIPRHWCYPDDRRRYQRRPEVTGGRKLTLAEDQALLDLLHSERFQDAAPRQVYATLLSEGVLVGSVSTMYRRLRAREESRERRNQRPAQHHVKPQLMATAPNQIMTWDITKLPTLTRGLYLNLYVILDLFSRYVVAWMVSLKENAGLARHLFSTLLTKRQIDPKGLTVHQDRGSPMIAHSFAELLSDLGVEQSFSRPRVSNDNAFSESQFKTTKNWPTYPGRFRDSDHAREWGHEFFPAYNQRPHQGLALFTPENVYTGQVETLWQVRQDTMDQHFADHPARYVNGQPIVHRPPERVCINPDDGQSAELVLADPKSFETDPTPVGIELPEVVT